MEIRQIRYAEAVARFSSFSKAANALFVTQQTLSQQIRKLEDEIGFPVFERSTRTVSLTERGRVFIRKAEELLHAYDRFSDDVKELKEDTDRIIRLGILPTFSHLNVLESIYDFQAHEHNVQIQAQIQKSRTLLDMLYQGSLDAAISNLSQEQVDLMKEDYEVRIFSRDHVCVILNRSHKLADKTEIHLSDLEGQTLLMLEKGSSIRTRMESVFEQNKLHPKIIECPEIYSMIGMVQSEYGIGFLSSQVAAKTITPSLVSLPLKPEMETITALIYKRDNPREDVLNRFASEFMKQNV